MSPSFNPPRSERSFSGGTLRQAYTTFACPLFTFSRQTCRVTNFKCARWPCRTHTIACWRNSAREAQDAPADHRRPADAPRASGRAIRPPEAPHNAAQPLAQTKLHASVPLLGHPMGARIPCRDERARTPAEQREQCVRRAAADAHLAAGRMVGRGAIRAQQARRKTDQSSRRASPNSTSRCTCTDISRPKPIITVIIADPPCDTSGSGTPPTGIAPITIAMLTMT